MRPFAWCERIGSDGLLWLSYQVFHESWLNLLLGHSKLAIIGIRDSLGFYETAVVL